MERSHLESHSMGDGKGIHQAHGKGESPNAQDVAGMVERSRGGDVHMAGRLDSKARGHPMQKSGQQSVPSASKATVVLAWLGRCWQRWQEMDHRFSSPWQAQGSTSQQLPAERAARLQQPAQLGEVQVDSQPIGVLELFADPDSRKMLVRWAARGIFVAVAVMCVVTTFCQLRYGDWRTSNVRRQNAAEELSEAES